MRPCPSRCGCAASACAQFREGDLAPPPPRLGLRGPMNTNAVRLTRKDRPSSLEPRDPVSAPGLLECWGYLCVFLKVCACGEGVTRSGNECVCARIRWAVVENCV